MGVNRFPVFGATVLVLVVGKTAGWVELPWLVIILLGTARVWFPPLMLAAAVCSAISLAWVLNRLS